MWKQITNDQVRFIFHCRAHEENNIPVNLEEMLDGNFPLCNYCEDEMIFHHVEMKYET